MSLSDPIADMLTRIRNGVHIRRGKVKVKASNICDGIARVLKEEGYISAYDRIDDGKQGFLRVFLKYSEDGLPAISQIKRLSKPGRRLYSTVKELPNVLGGMGITIVSTSKGVMSDRNCRKENIGGELICVVS